VDGEAEAVSRGDLHSGDAAGLGGVEGGADFLEQGGAVGVEEENVAAELGVSALEHSGAGFAHEEETAEVGGDGVGVAEFDIEFHEVGEGGLVKRIGLDGLGEHEAGLNAGTDGEEAIGDGDEIFRAHNGLIHEIGEKDATTFLVVEAVAGDGLEAVEDGGKAFGPLGVGGKEQAHGVESLATTCASTTMSEG
jgi:hypothetical protein